ncbi:DMT family transporter [Mesonia aquimarina]|uniref:DMT family transporter n=1 Tax=Mesonia aquimarina TaxID=1504967 RepID=UPI000EF58F9C|nr:DMT family transporter [Mesonia aquimarina]
MKQSQLKWVYLVCLALVWGSSFILIKKGLVGLTPIQLGALRTFLAGLFLISIGSRSVRKVKKHQWKWVAISGCLGSFFPAFLFAFAETQIDSAIVSILNSTVPILALIVGMLFFKISSNSNQALGVIVGLIGSVGLILAGASINENQNYWFALLPLAATTMYAFNVHIIKRYLQEIPVLGLTTGSFIVLLIPSLIVLYLSGFFDWDYLQQDATQISIGFIAILAVVGTGIAKILFNRMVQISTPVFSTSVTYLIPVVALSWGILDGELFNWLQALSGLVILLGVYFANKKKRKTKKPV